MAHPWAHESIAELLDRQAGVLSRAQAARHGMSDGALAARLNAGRWQRVHPAIYSATTGTLTVAARRWAAVLACGPDAILSQHTAAALHGLKVTQDGRIHVTVPAERRVTAPPGIHLHRSRRLAQTRHPTLEPPRTMVEATVADLAHAAPAVAAALAVVAQACQRRLTTASRLRQELAERSNMRWRREVLTVLPDVAAGAHSVLELRYLRDVERPHRLPAGRRQRAVHRGGRREWTDVSYDDYATVVELDGRLGHDQVTDAWRDMRRDNRAAVAGEVSLRYGWTDVTGRPCSVAVEVAAVLQSRGWSGKPRSCGGLCEL